LDIECSCPVQWCGISPSPNISAFPSQTTQSAGEPERGPPQTTNERIIKELDRKLGLGIRFLDTEDQPRGWLAFETGRVDAYVTDAIIEHGLIAKASNPDRYAVVGRLLSFDPYSVVVRRDDSAFRHVGNRVLADLFRGGEIQAIYDRWIGPIVGPPSDELQTVWRVQALPN